MNDAPQKTDALSIVNAVHALRTTPVPGRMRKLRTDRRGYPVPAFVHWNANGEPDFRVIEPAFLARCVRLKRCWICDEPLGAWLNFVIGPMCTVNRVSSEPASHYDCALYACRVCPFLTMPRMHRRDLDDVPSHVPPAGVMIERNPGVTALWTTRTVTPFRAGRAGGSTDGVLFRIGEPSQVQWFHRGQAPAPDDAIAESFRTGMPALIEPAVEQGPAAVEELRRLLGLAAALTPSRRLPADIFGMIPS